MERTKEIQEKLRLVRELLEAEKLDAVRFRGVDWFAWATGGGDSCVIFSSSVGVAEVLVSRQNAFVITSEIERTRLLAEQVSADFEMVSFPWAEPGAAEKFVAGHGKKIVSDQPLGYEGSLSPRWSKLKWLLGDEELGRYRSLGRDAALASTAALRQARPEWTEWDVAGAAAEALWQRGIHPLLTLVAGEERGAIYRHPVASRQKLGGRVTLVICGRRHGLFANFTRHLFFRAPKESERRAASDVATVEAEAFAATAAGADVDEVYERVRTSYESLGHHEQIRKHHQGGPCGYLSREAVARPGLKGWGNPQGPAAYAWNPSLPGAKIEDTVLRLPNGKLEVLTVDPDWPTVTVQGLARPDLYFSAP